MFQSNARSLKEDRNRWRHSTSAPGVKRICANIRPGPVEDLYTIRFLPQPYRLAYISCDRRRQSNRVRAVVDGRDAGRIRDASNGDTVWMDSTPSILERRRIRDD